MDISAPSGKDKKITDMVVNPSGGISEKIKDYLTIFGIMFCVYFWIDGRDDPITFIKTSAIAFGLCALLFTIYEIIRHRRNN